MNKFFKEKIHTHGKRHYGAVLPKELPRGRIGDCFDHCILLAMMFPQYRYVEGIAKVPNKKDWIYHAWLTDEKGEVAYDPTWHAKDESEEDVGTFMIHYIGVVMDTKKVADFMLETKYKAVLKNYWRAPELADKIFA